MVMVRVRDLVKAAPILRSSSCRTSTASASRSFIWPRVAMARSMEGRVISLNLARSTVMAGATSRHTDTTSIPMFSPSRSPSVQMINIFAVRACTSANHHLA